VLRCVVVVCGASVVVGAAVVVVGAVVVVVGAVGAVVVVVGAVGAVVVVVSTAPTGPAPIANIAIMSISAAPLRAATEARRGEEGRITGATLDRRPMKSRAINAGAEDRSRSYGHQ